MAANVLNFKNEIVKTGCKPDPPHIYNSGFNLDYNHQY